MELENKSTYYDYQIQKLLIKDINILTNIHTFNKIVLATYMVNDTNNKFPFLQYLLTNDNDLLSLPELPFFENYSNNKTDKDKELLNYSKIYLSNILNVNVNVQNDKNDNVLTNIDFIGFNEFNNNIYLFFDVTQCIKKGDINIDNYNLSDTPKFALISEIINNKDVCNIPIDESVTDFFIRNDYYINYLYDENNEPYEVPVVGYVGYTTVEKIKFVSMFGESAKTKSAICGPYFYFTNFNNAVRQGGWTPDYKPETLYGKLITDTEYGRYNRGGLVRFALFTETTKYVENGLNDPIDESDIKKERMNDPSLNQLYEGLTSRISDHDGLWTREHDSVYLENIELDNGLYLKETPVLVLKEYHQQVPLSWHFINKLKLGNEFEPMNHLYSIL